MYIRGFLRLSFAHHLLCWQYRNHVIRLNSNWSLCLDCSGFYSGTLLGFVIILVGILNFSVWSELILISTLFFVPTMLRIAQAPFFSTNKKLLLFIFRFLLGLGVIFGLFSILKAPNIYF